VSALLTDLLAQQGDDGNLALQRILDGVMRRGQEEILTEMLFKLEDALQDGHPTFDMRVSVRRHGKDEHVKVFVPQPLAFGRRQGDRKNLTTQKHKP
jgi:hypothetical protein